MDRERAFFTVAGLIVFIDDLSVFDDDGRGDLCVFKSAVKIVNHLGGHAVVFGDVRFPHKGGLFLSSRLRALALSRSRVFRLRGLGRGIGYRIWSGRLRVRLVRDLSCVRLYCGALRHRALRFLSAAAEQKQNCQQQGGDSFVSNRRFHFTPSSRAMYRKGSFHTALWQSLFSSGTVPAIPSFTNS